MEYEITKLAAELRHALNSVSPDTWRNVTITDFPRGACGHCAELLARYLRERMQIDATYVHGRVGDPATGSGHAWLEYDGIIMDISADQFGLPPVIVSRTSDFHTTALDVERHPIIRDHWWGTYAAPVWHEAMQNLAR